MTRHVVGKRKRKITAHALPVGAAARLTRADYAAATIKEATAQADVEMVRTASHAAATAKRRAIKGGAAVPVDGGFDLDAVIVKPHQISVAMRTRYATELLRQLRGAPKLRRGGCCQITVDCPVEIVIDAPTLGALIDKLEGEVGGRA